MLKNPLDRRINPRLYASERIRRCQLSDCRGSCCIFGVWLDIKEAEDILANAALIAPYMPEHLRDPGDWIAGVQDKDERAPSGIVVHTGVETRPDHYGGIACIFCLEDGKCALQVAAVANGLHPWRFKPFYCVLHPLDLDEEGRLTLDDAATVLAEEGSCLRPAEIEIPLAETFEPELRYLLGEKGYNAMLEEIAKRKKGV